MSAVLDERGILQVVTRYWVLRSLATGPAASYRNFWVLRGTCGVAFATHSQAAAYTTCLATATGNKLFPALECRVLFLSLYPLLPAVPVLLTTHTDWDHTD